MSKQGTRLWKAVLYPGRQQDAYGEWFTISQTDTANALVNCKKMLARGWGIPCVWEHQSGTNPIDLSHRDDWLANYVKNCFGEICDARRDSKGVLWLEHKVYDPQDAEKLKSRRMPVSPRLNKNFSDSKGGRYRGTSVGHVAATPSPVQFWQNRDWHESKELSQGASLYLSYTRPDMAKEEKPDDLKTETPPVEETPPAEPAPDEPKTPVGGGDSDLDALIEALREYGINVPEECEDLKHVIIAVKAAKGSKADDDLDLDPNAGAPTQPAASPPMMMSDPRTHEHCIRHQKKGMRGDIRGLFATGRIDRQTYRDLKNQIDASRDLSFTVVGELVPNRLVERIAALQEAKAWSAWKLDGKADAETIRELSATTVEEPHPASMTKNWHASEPSESEKAVIEETKRIQRERSGKPA